MRGPLTARSARRVEGVAEENEACDAESATVSGFAGGTGHDLGGDSATHRFAPDDQLLRGARHLLAGCFDDSSVAALEVRRRVWPTVGAVPCIRS